MSESFPFKPVLDRVLVQEDPVQENKVIGTTAQGNIVASQHYQKSRTYRGTVVATGTGVPMGGVLMDMPFEVGDRVWLDEFGGDRFYLNPEDEHSTDKSAPIYWIYRVSDIKGYLRA